MGRNPITCIARQVLVAMIAALASLVVVFGVVSAPGRAQGKGGRSAPKPARPLPAYPLKKSASGRYLVDQHNVPFLIAGDAPQALMVNITEDDADLYFANRRSHGFNA